MDSPRGAAIEVLVNQMKDARVGEGLSLLHVSAYIASPPVVRWLKAFEVCVDESRRMDKCTHGRSPLHYAAMSEDRSTCDVLINELAFSLGEMDSSGLTPIDFVPSTSFKEELLHLGKYRDVFISYAHGPETTEFSCRLADDLVRHGVSTWIDRDIGEGESWRKAIQDAIRCSGTVIVVLSKKWCNSNYCTGEASVLNRGKPFLPRICSRTLMGCFVSLRRGGETTHQ